jgi:hypothetical protein
LPADGEWTQRFPSHSLATGFGGKDRLMWEFLTSWYFFGICAVLLVMLIGVFIFLRSRGTGEDE